MALLIATFSHLVFFAEASYHQKLIPEDKIFDHSAELKGEQSCAIINLIIDEGETADIQCFLEDYGIPETVRLLKDNEYIDNVFICAYGYGSAYHDTDELDPQLGNHRAHYHGCTDTNSVGDLLDESIYGFQVEEKKLVPHDGYQAIEYAIDHLPRYIGSHPVEKDLITTCKEIGKTIILGSTNNWVSNDKSLRFNEIKEKILNNGYSFNVIHDNTFGVNGEEVKEAFGVSPNGILMKATEMSGGYYWDYDHIKGNNAMGLFIGHSFHYTQYGRLAFQTHGFAWSKHYFCAPGDGEYGNYTLGARNAFVAATAALVYNGPCSNNGDPNINHEMICPGKSILTYYPHMNNPEPEYSPMHNFEFLPDTGSVKFLTGTSSGNLDPNMHMWTQYDSLDGIRGCTKHSCVEDMIHALCHENSTQTIVHIFATGMGDPIEDNEVPPTCLNDDEEVDPSKVQVWSYRIACNCDAAVPLSDTNRSLLRASSRTTNSNSNSNSNSDDQVKAFLRGELFDEKMKKYYGLL